MNRLMILLLSCVFVGSSLSCAPPPLRVNSVSILDDINAEVKLQVYFPLSLSGYSITSVSSDKLIISLRDSEGKIQTKELFRSDIIQDVDFYSISPGEATISAKLSSSAQNIFEKKYQLQANTKTVLDVKAEPNLPTTLVAPSAEASPIPINGNNVNLTISVGFLAQVRPGVKQTQSLSAVSIDDIRLVIRDYYNKNRSITGDLSGDFVEHSKDVFSHGTEKGLILYTLSNKTVNFYPNDSLQSNINKLETTLNKLRQIIVETFPLPFWTTNDSVLCNGALDIPAPGTAASISRYSYCETLEKSGISPNPFTTFITDGKYRDSLFHGFGVGLYEMLLDGLGSIEELESVLNEIKKDPIKFFQEVLNSLVSFNIEQAIRGSYNYYQYSLEANGYSPYFLINGDANSSAFIAGYISPSLIPWGKLLSSLKLATKIESIKDSQKKKLPSLSDLDSCIISGFQIKSLRCDFLFDKPKSKNYMSRRKERLEKFKYYSDALIPPDEIVNNLTKKIYPTVDVPGYGLVGFPKSIHDGIINNGSPLSKFRISSPLDTRFSSSERTIFIKDWEKKYGKLIPPDCSTYDLTNNCEKYEVHHIKPLAYGGFTEDNNLLPLKQSDHIKFTDFWRQ